MKCPNCAPALLAETRENRSFPYTHHPCPSHGGGHWRPVPPVHERTVELERGGEQVRAAGGIIHPREERAILERERDRDQIECVSRLLLLQGKGQVLGIL